VTQNKRVSVIIPNFNYARFLNQAIESVLNQSYQNVELIVVNNGSTDNSLEVLSKYHFRLKIIDQKNLGQSGARNSGLLIATGEYIAFLDADDFWEPSKLQKQVDIISASCELVYCGIAPFNNENSERRPIISPKYSGNCSDYFVDLPGASIVLSGESTALFSRELLQRVGLFDVELNSTAGWDFFRRCSRYTEFNYVNESLVNYRLLSANMSNSSKGVIQDMRLAYSKLFSDKNWDVSKESEAKIRKSLEWSFLKTCIKDLELKLAVMSIFKLFQLISKFG